VFITRYKKIALLALFLGLSPSISANTWSDHLRGEMLESYDVLNSKVESCLKSRSPIEKEDIDSEWFSKLSNEQRGTALLMLSQMAMDRCASLEEANYTKDLLYYAAETGDSKRLDEWLSLKKVFMHEKQRETLSDLDFLNIKMLSKKEPFNKPFNPLQVKLLYED